MGAIIKVNGVVIPESYVVVDNSFGKVELGTPDRPWQTLDTDKVYAEVNLYGEIDL